MTVLKSKLASAGKTAALSPALGRGLSAIALRRPSAAFSKPTAYKQDDEITAEATVTGCRSTGMISL